MVIAGLVAVFFAVAAEQKSLEQIAAPLSTVTSRDSALRCEADAKKPGSPPGSPAG
jgi:hypothetical protein